MSSRLEQAIERFRRANALDPNLIDTEQGPQPKELHQAKQLATWVERLVPDASEPLRLAAWCQHLRRWEVARSNFPEGRIGYLKWRKHLYQFHADQAAEVLRQVGYDEATIAAVQAINLKQGLKTNPDTQAMEDALCLTFLEHELDEFAERYDDAKLVTILRKTWGKMSERGHEHARSLDYGPRIQRLLEQALLPAD